MNENGIFDGICTTADTAAAETVRKDEEKGESIPTDVGEVGALPDGDDGEGVGENGEDGSNTDERSEYERLIKERFKELYAEDMQRLVNRRFRKYKIMEERYKLLEEEMARKEGELEKSAQRIAEYESLLRSEIERTVKETEERVIGEIRAKRLRPTENGSMPHRSQSPFDISKLTRDERAALAKRAAGGEKIKF